MFTSLYGKIQMIKLVDVLKDYENKARVLL